MNRVVASVPHNTQASVNV